ncbi:class I SAM-dependent methyltransferase [Aestuariimicrobium sp. p3-SID1156]|uniref:class I SAM-dependent methyltransferase n=1 Tax=Aestuariimicrobium sp. p3-SID1156 TaxID=2916038 RepID=UPI00223B5F95|nr:class I SAM-dependent methyltransferase [Aestuariimicrobium sp. p3-SID1156]MCT1458558.1 class I SAM-dependent methyltransferase [Aestuariimicrobium sp. p3-SID1156]
MSRSTTAAGAPTGPRPGFRLPAAALEWLTWTQPLRILSLSGAALPRQLASAGHEVFALDKSQHVTESLRGVPGIIPVRAQAEQLPFDPCQFDAVICHQDLHRYAPGLVLSEIARVLSPGGHFGVSYLVRDDSVPWVRRLVARVQQVDPDAMRGAFGAESVAAVRESKYFPAIDEKSFRHWVPIDRAGLLDMVTRLPAAQGMADSDREQLAAEIGALHDDAAPAAGNLRLPYRLECWRAHVDHQELTAPIEVDDDGLVIRL